MSHTIETMAALVASKLTEAELVELALLLDEDVEGRFRAEVLVQMAEAALKHPDSVPGRSGKSHGSRR